MPYSPYVDKKGRSMSDNHHEILIQKNKAFVGPGHNSELVTDKKYTISPYILDYHSDQNFGATASKEGSAPFTNGQPSLLNRDYRSFSSISAIFVTGKILKLINYHEKQNSFGSFFLSYQPPIH